MMSGMDPRHRTPGKKADQDPRLVEKPSMTDNVLLSMRMNPFIGQDMKIFNTSASRIPSPDTPISATMTEGFFNNHMNNFISKDMKIFIANASRVQRPGMTTHATEKIIENDIIKIIDNIIKQCERRVVG